MSGHNYLHRQLHHYLGLYIQPGDRVAEIDPRSSHGPFVFKGCESLIVQSSNIAEHHHRFDGKPLAHFRADYVILNGNIHYEIDVQSFLNELHSELVPPTRVIIVYYSTFWKPWLRLATALGMRRKMPEENWIAPEDLQNLLLLANYDLVRAESKLLLPFHVPVISYLVNRFLAPLAGFRIFNLVNIAVARPLSSPEAKKGPAPSVSIVIPARNEAGNIEAAVVRTPKMGPDDELIFVEGNSTDNTWETVCTIQERYAATHHIRIAQQDGVGKGDAVRKGFGLAQKDIVMILDADLSVPPEELPRFYEALVSNKGEFINGSRLVYPMQKQAMRFFNVLANKVFAVMFSFVLSQRFKDTLCGTKALSRANYLKLAAHRSHFGEFDPFGDFDLIFGAARLALRMVEVPIHYGERTYGRTNIQRWRHGLLLLRMLRFAAVRIKFL